MPKCLIEWIDSKGNPTPDDHEAVCLVQAFDPRIPDPATGKWVIRTPFNLKEATTKYARKEGEWMLEDGTFALPCCEEHLARMSVFWRALPLPGQEEKDWHKRVREQLPAVAIENVINSFTDQAEEILKSIKYDYMNRCWFFTRWGMYIGIEADGYIHS